MTYAQIMGPLVNMVSTLTAAASAQSGTHPEILADILHHEIDVLLTGYYHVYKRDTAG